MAALVPRAQSGRAVAVGVGVGVADLPGVEVLDGVGVGAEDAPPCATAPEPVFALSMMIGSSFASFSKMMLACS